MKLSGNSQEKNKMVKKYLLRVRDTAMGPSSSYWVASPNPSLRIYTQSYCILLCRVQLISWQGLLFSEGNGEAVSLAKRGGREGWRGETDFQVCCLEGKLNKFKSTQREKYPLKYSFVYIRNMQIKTTLRCLLIPVD